MEQTLSLRVPIDLNGSLESHVRGYFSGLQETIDSMPIEVIESVIRLLHEARLGGRQVFILGNGGSASTASHFACDLAKNTRRADLPHFRVLSLADNTALFSAYANDEGYENVFVQQLVSLVLPGDIVIAISTSGNSPNVLKAVELANHVGAVTIGMTGFDGGSLSSMVDINIHTDNTIIEQVEDIHLILEHLICLGLKQLIQQDLSIVR